MTVRGITRVSRVSAKTFECYMIRLRLLLEQNVAFGADSY